MTEIVIDLPRAKELLATVVKGNEDFVYPKQRGGCFYEVKGAASCMIGHALHLAGVTIEELNAMDTTGPGAIQQCYKPVRLVITDDAIRYFGIAQARQDYGYTWGDSLSKANASVDFGNQ